MDLLANQFDITRNILIVDDDIDTCKLLETLFLSNGYYPKSVHSGSDAVSYIVGHDVDIVLLDIMMPDMDGWETTRRIRNISSVPILFLTALDPSRNVAHALLSGADDYIRKPFHPTELKARVNALLRYRDINKTNPSTDSNRQNERVSPPETTVVIPAYNEATALPLLLPAVFRVLDDKYEVLVVDDGSTDRTAEVARSFPCRLIKHQENRGKGAAIRTGIQEATGNKIIFLDADNTYPVEAIPTLSRLLDKNDIVRGIRRNGRENIPILNRIGNLTFDSIIRILNNVEGGDILSGMYGARKTKLLALDLQSEGFDIEAEICVKSQVKNFKCATVPISYAQRMGEKKLNAFYDGLRILYRVIQLALSFSPLMTFIIPGIFLLILGVLGISLVQLKHLHILNMPLAMNGTFLFGAIVSIGVQFIIFGTAVYAASMAYGLRGRANKTLDIISQILSTRISMLTGSIIGIAGFIVTGWLSVNWFVHKGPFTSTTLLVIMTSFMIFGTQVVSAGVFLSALKGLRKDNKPWKMGTETQVPQSFPLEQFAHAK